MSGNYSRTETRVAVDITDRNSMSANSKIEWCDASWNPTRGCSKASPGCLNCYAKRVASRFSGPEQPYEGLTRDGEWTGEVRFVPEMLAAPLHWKKPKLIFVNSMSDLFHKNITNEQIAAVFGVISACPQHQFQLLTKRAERMVEWFEWAYKFGGIQACVRTNWKSVSASFRNDECSRFGVNKYGGLTRTDNDAGCKVLSACGLLSKAPLPNLHLGVSVENQDAVWRIECLIRCPAAVRWVSVEPTLGPVDLGEYVFNRSRAIEKSMSGPVAMSREQAESRISESLNWVVCGAETGPGKRPMNLDWARSLRDQCQAASVPFFFKKDSNGSRELDGKVWEERP